MKKIIFMALVALGLGATTTASAQQPENRQRPTDEQIAKYVTDRIAEDLCLNEAQAKEVYGLQLEQAKRASALREAMIKEREEMANKMKGILTPEQYAKWSKTQSRSHYAPGRGGDNGSKKYGPKREESKPNGQKPHHRR